MSGGLGGFGGAGDAQGGLGGFGGLGRPSLQESNANAASLANMMKTDTKKMYEHLSPRGEVIKGKDRGGRTLVSTKRREQAMTFLRGKVKLYIKEARNLAKADFLGLSDPYAICQTTEDSTRYKTKTIKKTLDPKWEENTTFTIVRGDGELLITVWDWDLIGKDDFLGVLSIPLAQIAEGLWAEGKWSVFTRETSEKSKKKAPGELFLRIEWEPEQAEKKVEIERPLAISNLHHIRHQAPKKSRRDLFDDAVLLSPKGSPTASPTASPRRRKPSSAQAPGSPEIKAPSDEQGSPPEKTSSRARGASSSHRRRESKTKEAAPSDEDRSIYDKAGVSPRQVKDAPKVSASAPTLTPEGKESRPRAHSRRKSDSRSRESKDKEPKEDKKDEDSDKQASPRPAMKKPMIPSLVGAPVRQGEAVTATGAALPKASTEVKKPPAVAAAGKPKALALSMPAGGMKLNLATVPEKGMPVGQEPAAVVDPPRSASFAADSSASALKRATSGQVTDRIGTDAEFAEKYELGKVLGEGAFAVVRKGTRKKDNMEVAIKIANKMGHWTESTAARFKLEIEIIFGLDYKHVVSVYDISETLESVYIVMELVPGGDLFHEIVRTDVMDERRAAVALWEIILGVRYIHDNQICHRDLKPENILLNARRHCKIADFGISCYFKEGVLINEWAGTMLYMAPEMMNGKGYTQMVDMWAVGVIAYNALSGTSPFDGGNNAQLLAAVSESKLEFPADDWKGISKEAKDFVSRLIEHDVKKRMTPDKALQHPWLVKALKAHQQSQAGRTSPTPSIQVDADEVRKALEAKGVVVSEDK